MEGLNSVKTSQFQNDQPLITDREYAAEEIAIEIKLSDKKSPKNGRKVLSTKIDSFGSDLLDKEESPNVHQLVLNSKMLSAEYKVSFELKPTPPNDTRSYNGAMNDEKEKKAKNLK